MINKNYFIFAAAIALASCSVDEYVGENPEFTQTTKENIIGFGGGTGSMSRATQNTGNPEVMLDKHFKVYGCKSTSTQGPYQVVFNNYWVWYDTNTSSSTSNSNSWEYVGDQNTIIKGNDNTEIHTLSTAQYIKYWDYSADHYRFVAGSPYNSFTFNINTMNSDNGTAEVTGLTGHINPNADGNQITSDPKYLAVAKVEKANYGAPVQLKFTRLQTKVRVGIYETIPGYSIENIEFYNYNVSSTSSDKFSKDETNNSNVILTSATPNYFNGGKNVKATVGYTWTGANAPSYTVTYAHGDETNKSGYESSQNWYGGKFSGVKATSSNPTTKPSGSSSIKEALYGTDNDMDDHGYFTVLSTTVTTPSPLVIKCDFTLNSLDGSGETIKVTGATAAIPAAYCKWDDNKMYTYIFKISQETNGHTGVENKPGLYPITFDAAATATEEGVETIVQTPSITTYQKGSVVNNGGIVFIKNKPIEITVAGVDGNPKELNQTTPSISEGYIAVYNLGTADENAKTEAELTVTPPSSSSSIGTVNLSKHNNSDANDNKATFTPSGAGYYAIQYCYGANSGTPAYKYKVIKVENNLPETNPTNPS